MANLHFHILYLDGVYEEREDHTIFHRIFPPQKHEMAELVKRIHKRLTRFFIKKGYLEEDHTLSDGASAPLAEQNPLLAQCIAASVQNRIALGDRAGQKTRSTGEVDSICCQAFGGTESNERSFKWRYPNYVKEAVF